MKINEFTNRYRFLSNFFTCSIVYDGQKWKTAEHLFQGLKTDNSIMKEKIRRAATPGQAKKLGRRVWDLKSNWKQKRNLHMLVVLRLKFRQNARLAIKLSATEDAILEEGNHWHDNYWGNCFCLKCESIKGRNQLGKLLMQIRKELKNEDSR